MEVPVLGERYTGMSFTDDPAADSQEMIALIRTALEHGIIYFGMVEAYGSFVIDELVGKALKPVRSHLVIATSLGLILTPPQDRVRVAF